MIRQAEREVFRLKYGKKWGASFGERAAIAVVLAARRHGTTMGEIKSHTGQYQNNVFKRLKELGHVLKRDGKGETAKIVLRHKDGRKEHVKACLELPLIDDIESGNFLNTAATDTTLEFNLQASLRANLHKLEPGLKAIDGGKEELNRDITAKDARGNIVVVEIKAVKAGQEAVAQLLAYMGEIAVQERIPRGKVRGILVAPAFQKRTVYAASMVKAVTLKQNQQPLVFSDVET